MKLMAYGGLQVLWVDLQILILDLPFLLPFLPSECQYATRKGVNFPNTKSARQQTITHHLSIVNQN
jgi:hypothetical protein